MNKNIFCGFCLKRTKKAIARRIQNPYAIEYLRSKKNEFDSSSLVCARCFTNAYKNNKKVVMRRNRRSLSAVYENQDIESLPSTSVNGTNMDLNTSSSNITKSESRITLKIKRTSNSHSNCFLCKSKNNLQDVTLKARCQAFVQTNITIPSGARCCKIHLVDDLLSDEALNNIEEFSENITICPTELEQLLQELRKTSTKGLDFDNDSYMSDNDYYQLTGITKNNFNTIANCIKSKIRSTSSRSYRTCLAILLVKLRTGLSHSVLSVLFKLKKRVIGRSIHSATKALMSKFVPLHLGLDHMSRQELIEKHTRSSAKKLFANEKNDVAIIIADGTYVYIEKSSNYLFQRRTYSMHKHRPLVKPMILVSTTGYILQVLGPYFTDGKNNDAAILNSALTSSGSSLRQWLHSDDILIVHRGFRDSQQLLEDLGLISKMPHFLCDKSQHTTAEANESRLITSIRWVVESVNGLIKRWKALGQVIPNSQIPLIGDYVRIICAICNAFRPPRIGNSQEYEVIASRMLNLVTQPNQLNNLIESENWIKRRVVWTKIDASILEDFPQLTMTALRNITIVVYQIKQAKSYTEEHFNDLGLYELYVHKERHDDIRVQLQSRHSSSKIYNAWIQYNNCFSPPINGWYCQCKVGARVVGCCAHVAAVLWYLGYHRYMKKEKSQTVSYSDYILDAATSQWSDDNDSENSS